MTEQKIAEKTKNALEVKDGANGLKFILSAALVVFAHQLDMLNNLIETYPQWSDYLNYGIIALKQAISWTAWASENVGFVGMFVGVAHKAWKFWKG